MRGLRLTPVVGVVFGLGIGCLDARFVDVDGDGVAKTSDCNDEDATVYPGAKEVCDESDNNCDGLTDEARTDDVNEAHDIGALPWFSDIDADGYGGDWTVTYACNQPLGYADNSDDCDDNNALIHPGATEDDCNDPVDYNCDGLVEFEDADADGWAHCMDCDDANPFANPDLHEYCDGIDNDCDGTIDESSALGATTWYIDYDGDGFGSNDYSEVECEQPSGFAANNTDCNDLRADTYPGAEELCDGYDNDCDAAFDEDCG